jgi:hypothetical protein
LDTHALWLICSQQKKSINTFITYQQLALQNIII